MTSISIYKCTARECSYMTTYKQDLILHYNYEERTNDQYIFHLLCKVDEIKIVGTFYCTRMGCGYSVYNKECYKAHMIGHLSNKYPKQNHCNKCTI